MKAYYTITEKAALSFYYAETYIAQKWPPKIFQCIKTVHKLPVVDKYTGSLRCKHQDEDEDNQAMDKQ